MKKLFYSCLSLIFLISACSTGPTSTPTTVPVTAMPPATVIPPTVASATSAVTATPAATTSADSPGCTDAAAFVTDVTVPDYSHFDTHETFTKTWRVKNIGTCS